MSKVEHSSGNVALGISTLKNLDEPTGNTIIGNYAGSSGTIDASGVEFNVVVGAQSLANLGYGNSYNTVIGTNAAPVADATNSIVIGFNACETTTTMGDDIIIGNNAGSYYTGGSGNIAIGQNTNPTTDGSNNIVIGSGINTDFSYNNSNSILIGNNIDSSMNNVMMLGTDAIENAFLYGDTIQLVGDNITTSGVITGDKILCNDISCNTINVDTIYVAGSVVEASGSYVDLVVTDTLTIGDPTVITLNSSGTITTTGPITGGSLVSTGAITCTGLDTTGDIDATGTITGGSLEATGSITGDSVTANTSIMGATISSDDTINAFGTITGGSLVSTGTITGGSLVSTGAITGTSLTVGQGTLTGKFLNDQNLSNIGSGGFSHGAYVAWNQTGGHGETDIINSRGGGGNGGWNFYDVSSNTDVSNNLPVIQINRYGDITQVGDIHAQN